MPLCVCVKYGIYVLRVCMCEAWYTCCLCVSVYCVCVCVSVWCENAVDLVVCPMIRAC